MNLRSRLGALQLPVAGLGLVVVAWSAYRVATIPPAPPDSDGFVQGLAVFAFYAAGLVGFVVAALGLAIPPGDGPGIRFGRWQRRLFLLSAAAAAGSAFAPLVAWPALAGAGLGPNAVVAAWLGLSAVAAIAFAGGLGWRAAQAVGRRAG